jgi:hypothetical protein
MRFSRSLAAFPLLLILASLGTPARAQTNSAGAATFPALQKLQEDLRQQELNPTSTPPSQGPFGNQPLLPSPAEHPVPPAEAPSPWLITPQIQLSETATDNANFSDTDRKADLQSFINPSVMVTGDTPRAKVDLSYSPIITRNVVATNNDRIEQNLFGTGTFSVVPDALFLNTRLGLGGLAQRQLRSDQSGQFAQRRSHASARL